MPLRTTKLDCRPCARPASAKLPPPLEGGISAASWLVRLGWSGDRLVVQLKGDGPKQRPGCFGC